MASLKRQYSENSKAGLTTLYCTYRIMAKKRGYAFELTKEQFRKLTKGDCFFCGAKPRQIKASKGCSAVYTYNGIDRWDNNVGYIFTNCVPCCGVCNRMKSATPGEKFLRHVKKISNSLGFNI